jgi:hypothetical protein
MAGSHLRREPALFWSGRAYSYDRQAGFLRHAIRHLRRPPMSGHGDELPLALGPVTAATYWTWTMASAEGEIWTLFGH